MKNILRAFGILALIICLFAFQEVYTVRKATAEVNQEQGLYIFMGCKPVKEYEYLGTVKSMGNVMQDNMKGMINSLIKKAKKEHPEAEAIIFTYDEGAINNRCDVVKFK